MTAPNHVQGELADQPRTGLPLPPSRRAQQLKPAALGPEQPTGATFGNPGPDQGFGLKLANRFVDRIVVADRESVDDAVAGCVNVGLARAAMFGRGPVIHDFTVAYTVWGFLGEAPAELVELRRPLFMSASHHYWDQRDIVDSTPRETLLLSHAEVQRRWPSEWRSLLGLS